jgi:hypothetical protein
MGGHDGVDGTTNGKGLRGSGGCYVGIRCHLLTIDSSTATGAISSKGGRGGDGADAQGDSGLGSGGGGGGGGGFVDVDAGGITGTKSDFIDVSGGRSGDGGDSKTTGSEGAASGSSGQAGGARIRERSTGKRVEFGYAAGTAGVTTPNGGGLTGATGVAGGVGVGGWT